MPILFSLGLAVVRLGAALVGLVCLLTAVVAVLPGTYLTVQAIDHWQTGQPWKSLAFFAAMSLLGVVSGAIMARCALRLAWHGDQPSSR